jgi:hypothetical protein
MLHGDQLILAGIVLATVLGIAAIVTAVIVYRRQRTFTSVDYQIIADIKLLIDSDAADAFANRIEVTYNSAPVRQPRVVDVKVMNTGNTPVKATDYDRPIVFELDGGRPPIDATIIGESTPRITGNLFRQQPDTPRPISIQPSLLNQSDWFTLRMLFDNNNSRIVGTHRIVGAQPMRHYNLNLLSPQAKFIGVFHKITYASSVFVFGAIIWVGLAKHLRAAEISVLMGVGVGGVCLLMGIAALLFMPRSRSDTSSEADS